MTTFFLFLTSTLALAYSPKIDPRVIQSLQTDSANSAIVVLHKQANLSNINERQSKEARGQAVYDALRTVALETQTPVLEFLKAKGLEHRRFYIKNMIAVYNPTLEQLDELAKLPEVASVNSNARFRFLAPITKAQLTPTYAKGVEASLDAVGASKVWAQGFTGKNIVVAGQDTGIQWDHPALKPNYRGSVGTDVDHDYNWHDSIHLGSSTGNSCGYDTKAPCDDHGHGTHTIGTVAGDDLKGNQVGMAPKAQWIGCRNMDEGIGTPATYIECFEFFLAPYKHGANPLTDGVPDKAPHVINNSWGCPTAEGCHGDELLAILTSLKKAGVIVVAAAGNEGPGCGSIGAPPASHSADSIAVGALDHRTGKIAYFSSRGPSAFDKQVGPDVSAPGVEVRSAIPGGKFASAGWSGTSMASPHVTGAVALLLSAKPTLIGDFEGINALLTKHAVPKTANETCGGVAGTAIPNNTYGYGMLDTAASVKIALSK